MLAEYLRDSKPELWNAFDQRRAEAELRYTLVVPIVLLSAVFAWAGSPIYLLGVLFPLALLLWAQRLEKESLKTIGIALNAGFIDDYLVEYLEKNHTADRPTDAQIVVRGAAALSGIRNIRELFNSIRWSVVEYFRRKVGDRYY